MTRPRPSIGPALAGAVDLSALKQPAAQAGPGGDASAPAGATEITEANFEDEVLVRSNQVPVVVLLWSPRSNACVQLADALAALATADGGTWSLATVNVDSVPRVAQVFGVDAVPTALRLSRETMRVIRENLRWALCYNLVCIPVAACGLVNPVIASAATG